MPAPSRILPLEDGNGKKWDRCLTDAILKTAWGLTIGAVLSGVFFKRRPWPIFFGIGIGMGIGYSNCQNDLRSSNTNSK